MPETIYVILYFARIFLGLLSFAMLLRALLSWIDFGGSGKFTKLIYTITEPALMPIRTLFYKKNWFSQTPIDMSFAFTVLIIMIFEMIIESLMRNGF